MRREGFEPPVLTHVRSDLQSDAFAELGHLRICKSYFTSNWISRFFFVKRYEPVCVFVIPSALHTRPGPQMISLCMAITSMRTQVSGLVRMNRRHAPRKRDTYTSTGSFPKSGFELSHRLLSFRLRGITCKISHVFPLTVSVFPSNSLATSWGGLLKNEFRIL